MNRERFRRMARHPSSYAPAAAEVLAAPEPMHFPDPAPPLRAVLDDPDADAPRLAYADWIETTDPERATFIRMQLAEQPAAPNPSWAEPLRPFGARDLVYRRGFVEEVSLTGRSFISLGEGLFRTAPIRAVRLIAVNFLISELISYPHLAKLRMLDLRGNRLDPRDTAALKSCEYLQSCVVRVDGESG